MRKNEERSLPNRAGSLAANKVSTGLYTARNGVQIRGKRLPFTRSPNHVRSPDLPPPSVGFSVSGLAVIRLGQQTVAVVRRVFVRGNRVLRLILMPLPPKVIVRVIFEEELHIFLTVAAEQFDVPRGTRNHRHCLCFFPQG